MKKYLVILFLFAIGCDGLQHSQHAWKPTHSVCVDGVKYYTSGHAVFPAYDKTTSRVVTCEEK